MAEQEHFLERTLRLGDAECDRALTIYRSKDARAWLVRAAERAGAARDASVAVPLGPESSPGHVILRADGEVVTCLSAGMAVIGAHALAWKDLDAVLRELPVLSGKDPDPYWTQRRLYHDLVHAGGWFSREAYETILREPLWMGDALTGDMVEAIRILAQMMEKAADALSMPAERQPKPVREAMDKMLWHLRHLVNLAGDLRVLEQEKGLLTIIHWRVGHIEVAAGVALGRFGPGVFDTLQRQFFAEKDPWRKAAIVRAIALVAARQPSVAAATGKLLRRIREIPFEAESQIFIVPAMVSVFYLAAQGGRVASEALSSYRGHPDPAATAGDAMLWEECCGELHERWPPATWRPVDLYIPHAQAEVERRKGPRPCPAPLETVGGGICVERVAPKVGRNDPCPCGSGKKAKRCCGTKGKYEERCSDEVPEPLGSERRAYQAMRARMRQAGAEAPEAGESEA